MKNKKLLFKSGLVAFICLCFGLSFGSALNFHLNLEGIRVMTQNSVLDNMMYVHFADNKNDFGGFMYFSDGFTSMGTEGELFEIGTDEENGIDYECTTQVKGFYYNAERGERLWPLDQDTRSGVLLNAGLETTGGIYTNCTVAGYKEALTECENTGGNQTYEECAEKAREKYKADGYGYYGYIEQRYSGQNLNLIMGVNYNTGSTPFISIKSGSDLSPTFVRVENKYPVGFIYDYNGGVGLAGCRFSGSITNAMKLLVDEAQGSGLSEMFEYDTNEGMLKYEGGYLSLRNKINCDTVSAADSLVKIIVEGIMGLDSSGSGNAKFGAMGNSTDTKMQYFATKSVNNITMINYARRKAETLCRGKWLGLSHDSSDIKDKIVCLNGNGRVDASNSIYSGKTLIVKGEVDVQITPDKDKVYDIFVDGGNLLVDENTGTQKVVIKSDGFISSSEVSGFELRSIVDYFDIDYDVVIDCILGLNDICYKAGLTGYLNGDDIIDVSDVSMLINCHLGRLGEGYDHGDCELSGDVATASVIKGNFIVDGKIMGDTEDGKLKNKYFIYGKMTTRDDLSDLEDTFSWRCEAGIANDFSFCPGGKKYPNPYQNAALVIIDQNYDSPLLKS